MNTILRFNVAITKALSLAATLILSPHALAWAASPVVQATVQVSVRTTAQASGTATQLQAANPEIDPDRFEIDVPQDLDLGIRNTSSAVQSVNLNFIQSPTAHGPSSCYLRTELPPRTFLLLAQGTVYATRRIHAVFDLRRQPTTAATTGPATSGTASAGRRDPSVIATLECWRGTMGMVEGDVSEVIRRFNEGSLRQHLRARPIPLELRAHRISSP